MAVTTQALRGGDGSIVATWVHGGGIGAIAPSLLHKGSGSGELLGSAEMVGYEWQGHVVGDARRPRPFANREDAMVYVVNRCQQVGSIPTI